MKQLLLDFTQAPAPTFANFVPGRNAEALAALREAAGGAYRERVLYLWGDSGAGKSHLVQAFSEAAEGRSVRRVRGAQFTESDVAPVMAIDDVEDLAEPEQIALFNAFNERRFECLVVTANAAPRDARLRRDLATRLATGLTYRVLALSDEEKRDALAAHANARGFALADDVSSYLLTHARRDMPSLMGALDTLDRYSLETGRPITLPLLKAALQPQASA
ncbi:DnaA regulatory inactivator Hda [Betaproteobacteria bacterium GR16-43]|nr:DnaA regulatory inactivator Hda [Betaproteobacteria bacterium GR16-43]